MGFKESISQLPDAVVLCNCPEMYFAQRVAEMKHKLLEHKSKISWLSNDSVLHLMILNSKSTICKPLRDRTDCCRLITG